MANPRQFAHNLGLGFHKLPALIQMGNKYCLFTRGVGVEMTEENARSIAPALKAPYRSHVKEEYTRSQSHDNEHAICAIC